MSIKTPTRAQLEALVSQLNREIDELKMKLAYAEATQAQLIRSYATAQPQGQQHGHQSAPDGDLLSRLTFKQHAVLTATLAGVKYQDIAAVMGVDVTTVKLHLVAAMKHLGIEGGRDVLLIKWSQKLDAVNDYEERYGLPKDWFAKRPAAVMKQLAPSRPAKFPPRG